MDSRKITVLAIIIALTVVITRLVQVSFVMSNFTVRVGLGFLPISLCGMQFGPLWGGIVSGLADVLRATLFPQGNPYNPLFTITAVMRGVAAGFFLYQRNLTIANVIALQLFVALVINAGVNTFFLWLSYSSQSDYFAFWLAMFPSTLANFVVNTGVFLLVYKRLPKIVTEL